MSATVSRLMEDPKLRKVKSAAKALSDAGDDIPEYKRQEYSLIVQEHFSLSASALTPEMISQAATMKTQKENANFVSHGFVVVQKVSADGNILEFEKMWRKKFVDNMKPKFLPALWSVDGPHDSLERKEYIYLIRRFVVSLCSIAEYFYELCRILTNCLWRRISRIFIYRECVTGVTELAQEI